MNISEQPRRADIKSVSVLIPVFNAEKTIGPLIENLVELYQPVYSSFEIVLVNDGSVDRSKQIIEEKVEKYPGWVKLVTLAKNFGEHNAVMCGLSYVRGDATVILDDDMQNPPSEVGLMVEKLKSGYDVVYSYYDQMHQPFFRKAGSKFSNSVATLMLGKPKNLYLSSFKALNACLVKAILRYGGPFPYIDGLILRSTSSIGQQRVTHLPRKAGRSNYNLIRLVQLWMSMFTGFSIIPLRIASFLGLFISALGFLMSIFFIYTHFRGPIFIHRNIPPGWASLMVAVTFFGGIQLCILGLIGEYLGRLFLTVNRMPQFFVRETSGFN